MWFILILAGIAAGVSVVAAVLSYRAAGSAAASAGDAARAAQTIAPLNHRIAALDAEATQFQDDYRKFLTAMGEASVPSDYRAVLAAGQILQANPRASDDLSTQAVILQYSLLKTLESPTGTYGSVGEDHALSDKDFEPLRAAFSDATAVVAAERDRLMALRWQEPTAAGPPDPSNAPENG